MIEDWRQIDGALAGYEVSSFGRVRGPSNALLKGCINKTSQQLTVCIKRADATGWTMQVKALVYRTFIDPGFKDKARLTNLDGDAMNCAVSNLAPRKTKAGITRMPADVESIPGEQWGHAPGYSQYLVSTEGRVRRKGGRLLTGKQNHNGYACFNLIQDEGATKRAVKVHALVLAAHGGPRPEGAVIRHLDDDPANNRLGNLAYGTRDENRADAVRNKAKYRASIDWRVICDIRDALYYGTSTVEELRKTYRIPERFIIGIMLRKIGADVSFLG